MAKKTSKPSNSFADIPDATFFWRLTDEQLNRVAILLEQILGMNELLFLTLQSEIEKSNSGMTAWKVIEDKAKEAKEIVNAAECVTAKK